MGMGDPVGSGSGGGGKKNSRLRRVVDRGSHIVDSTIGRFGRRGRGSIGRMGGTIASGSGGAGFGGTITSGSGEDQEPFNLKRKREFVKSESMEDMKLEDMKLVTKKSFEKMSRGWPRKAVAARADSQIRDPDWTEETGTPPSESSD